MAPVLAGRAWCFDGILDVDWEICPRQHMRIQREHNVAYEEQLKYLGQYCLTQVDPEFPKKVQPGDFVVGTAGMGYGHDHDHACMALKGAGVGAVICEGTNTNFKRNCIHHGLPVVEVRGIMNEVKTGDELQVDLAAGTVRNVRTDKLLRFAPYPDFILEMLASGGLYAHLTKEIEAGKY